MKALLLLVGCMVILSGLAGCQSGGKAVEVIIAGDGQFPSCLAGTWKADYGWQITFEDDGDISSSVIALGAVRITPGETSVVPMKLGGEGVYEPGTWIVQYDPEDRSLNVEVVIKAFRAELGDDILEGTTIDYLFGTVSEDCTEWRVDWFADSKYTAHTAKGTTEIGAKPEDAITPLVFTRISP